MDAMEVSELCHCGLPLHYTDPQEQARVEDKIRQLGALVKVSLHGRIWLVPRHYIALHGWTPETFPNLGFAEFSGFKWGV